MQKILVEALKRGKAEHKNEALEYIRFRKGFRKIERGTVIFGNRVIWGYPHIKRIFRLKEGIKRNINVPVIYAEEKIDGFNIRIASIKGKIYAFSRGGFLDSFVTEKVRDLGFERYFKKNPNHVLCAEMIGNTPYTTPTDDFDVKIFVFDIDSGDGTYLPPSERYVLLKEYELDGVPQLGKFESNDYKGLAKLALRLNKSRKEGMVLKSKERRKVVKYVTPWSDIDDITKAVGTFFDMPIGFYYQRILRSAFFIEELGLDRDKYSKELGKAFYKELINAIKRARKGKPAEEEFEILIKKGSKAWDDTRRHMSKEVRIEELWKRMEEDRIRIRFRKIYKKTSKQLIEYAEGKGVID